MFQGLQSLYAACRDHGAHVLAMTALETGVREGPFEDSRRALNRLIRVLAVPRGAGSGRGRGRDQDEEDVGPGVVLLDLEREVPLHSLSDAERQHLWCVRFGWRGGRHRARQGGAHQRAGPSRCLAMHDTCTLASLLGRCSVQSAAMPWPCRADPLPSPLLAAPAACPPHACACVAACVRALASVPCRAPEHVALHLTAAGYDRMGASIFKALLPHLRGTAAAATFPSKGST